MMADINFDNMSEEELDAHVLAQRKAAVNKRIETAVMLENQHVLFGVEGHLPDGQPTSSNRSVRPQDEDYQKVCQDFKLEKPGDSYLRQYTWEKGVWVLESEREFR